MTKLQPGESTDGAIFFAHDGKPLTGGKLVVRTNTTCLSSTPNNVSLGLAIAPLGRGGPMHRPIIFLIAAAAAVTASAQSNIASSDIPNLAAGVMQQTHMARQAIASHDRDSAIGHVKQAIATVSAIQQKASDGARPLMVPIYSQLDTTTTVTPVHKNADLKHNSSIRGVEGQTTTERLDVTAAADRLPERKPHSNPAIGTRRTRRLAPWRTASPSRRHRALCRLTWRGRTWNWRGHASKKASIMMRNYL